MYWIIPDYIAQSCRESLVRQFAPDPGHNSSRAEVQHRDSWPCHVNTQLRHLDRVTKQLGLPPCMALKVHVRRWTAGQPEAVDWARGGPGEYACAVKLHDHPGGVTIRGFEIPCNAGDVLIWRPDDVRHALPSLPAGAPDLYQLVWWLREG